MADFEVNRRLKKIIETVYRLSPLEFSLKYNDKKGQKTYNIINETHGLSNKMLEEILYAYPEINKVWLLTGEGEMMKNTFQENKTTVESPNIISIPQEIWEVIKNQAECLKESEKQGERIDRLITLLEKKLDNFSDGDGENKKDVI